MPLKTFYTKVVTQNEQTNHRFSQTKRKMGFLIVCYARQLVNRKKYHIKEFKPINFLGFS